MSAPDYDLCVIGGGINGAGIARDAAGRGLKVLLVEQGDLAGATSSASTKLIHGGLRYLEHFQWGLVREALSEREVLMTLAPHLVRPMAFVLAHDRSMRPAWLIRLGLFLYDHLGKRVTLPASQAVRLAGGPLAEHYTGGFRYADCWVDDARLAIVNAIDAAERGATVLTYTECTGLTPDTSGRFWTVQLKGRPDATARAVVNATRPWVGRFLDRAAAPQPSRHRVRLVKGSHIVVRRFFEGEQAYVLQQPDKRIVFVLPYEGDFALIGTTDVDFDGDPAAPQIDAAEIDYLLGAVNRAFRHQLAAADLVWRYSGVRPLLDEGTGEASAASRDYRLTLDRSLGPPLLSVFGGKITTYRRLSQQAVDRLTDRPAWTAGVPLPGAVADLPAFVAAAKARHAALPPALVERYASSYGDRLDLFVDARAMGRHFGDQLHEAEIRYLIGHEWARTADDILWRRSKLGLHIAPETAQTLARALPQLIKETMAA